MVKKDRTPDEQAAIDIRMAKMRAAKNNNIITEMPPLPEHPEEDKYEDLQRQVNETNKLLQAFMAGASQSNNQGSGLSVGAKGNLVGEVEKYVMAEENYPDMTDRLYTEPRLQNIAFRNNYEVEYTIAQSSYETKTGINMVEPRFHVTLYRILLDDDGNQTNKSYIARKLTFHEDPQAAMTIAKEQGVEIDRTDEVKFLNEMRYLRVRDWIFDIFWPKPAQAAENVREEVIGGSLVQVVTRNSPETGEIDFSKIKNKVV
jgi:hypothetical protein